MKLDERPRRGKLPMLWRDKIVSQQSFAHHNRARCVFSLFFLYLYLSHLLNATKPAIVVHNTLLKEFNAAFALYTKPIKIVAQRAAQVGEIRRPLALAFVDRCLLMQTVRIGAAIAFDVVSTLNGNDERLLELELRRQQQYTHIYNKTQSTTTTKQQSTTQPKATTFNNIRIIIPSSTPTTTSTTTTTTTATATAAASASTSSMTNLQR
jgi:hypothetical protein